MIILPSYIRDYFISRYTNPPSISWKVNTVFFVAKPWCWNQHSLVSPKCMYCCLILPKPNGTCGPFYISRLTRSSTCLGFLSPICTSAGGCSKLSADLRGWFELRLPGILFGEILKTTPVDSHYFLYGCMKYGCTFKSHPIWITVFHPPRWHVSCIRLRWNLIRLGGSRSKTRKCIRITGNPRFPTVDGRFESLLFTWFFTSQVVVWDFWDHFAT